MIHNLVHKKIQEFARPIYLSKDEFLDLLKTSSRSQKMSIRWETASESVDGEPLNAHMTQHLIWWDSSKFSASNRGGSETKWDNDQLNLQVTPGTNNWRTLSFDRIDMVAFKGKLYKVR